MHGHAGTLLWGICYFLIVLGLSAYGIHRYSIIYLYFKNRHRKPAAAAKFDLLPVVTVQLPIFNEVHVVERLLKAISELDYPKDKLEIQVLDDSNDETRALTERTVAKLRANGFDAVVLHRENRIGFKAGALDNGFKKAKGDFFFILDADFVPPRNILRESIDYFADPRVGMIQTRWGHINRSFSWLTRAQAILLDGHLVLEQTARSRTGRFFNFNGTAGLWRKRCIGESGGWQHDTLTEDLDLSYRAQLRGWKFVFLADIVTPAELPVDMDGFKSQQHRWTKGSIQTCKKVLPRIWRSKLPFFIKVEATAHLTANFAYLLLVCLCVLLHPSSAGGNSSVAGGVVRMLLIDLPIFAATTMSTAVSIFARKGNSIRKIGNAKSGFYRLSWRWELAYRLTMLERCWKPSLTAPRISIERPNTASKGPSNSGRAATTPRSGRSSRSWNLFSRSTLATLYFMLFKLGNFCQYRF